MPNFAEYEKATTRKIPVVVLDRVDGSADDGSSTSVPVDTPQARTAAPPSTSSVCACRPMTPMFRDDPGRTGILGHGSGT